jgi:molecular chaperone GrpE
MNNRYREEEKEDVMAEEEKVVEVEMEEKEEKISEELVKANEEINRLNDLYLRTLAEADNFRKRINEERIRERKYGSQSLLEKLVGALDVFDRVVATKTDDEKLKSFLQGFDMINQHLKQILVDEGVKKIETLYQPFNPAFQHAVEVGNNEKYAQDIVIGELQSGFMYKDRVLRPALVVVNKKNQEENK